MNKIREILGDDFAIVNLVVMIQVAYCLSNNCIKVPASSNLELKLIFQQDLLHFVIFNK